MGRAITAAHRIPTSLWQLEWELDGLGVAEPRLVGVQKQLIVQSCLRVERWALVQCFHGDWKKVICLEAVLVPVVLNQAESFMGNTNTHCHPPHIAQYPQILSCYFDKQ